MKKSLLGREVSGEESRPGYEDMKMIPKGIKSSNQFKIDLSLVS